MNIRIPDTLSPLPEAVQALPARIRQADSRTRLIAGIIAVLAAVYVAYRLLSGPAAPPKPVPARFLTSTKTSVPSRSRMIRSISPPPRPGVR